MTTQFSTTQTHFQPLLTLVHREKLTYVFQRQHIQTCKPLTNPAETDALHFLLECSGHLPWLPHLIVTTRVTREKQFSHSHSSRDVSATQL